MNSRLGNTARSCFKNSHTCTHVHPLQNKWKKPKKCEWMVLGSWVPGNRYVSVASRAGLMHGLAILWCTGAKEGEFRVSGGYMEVLVSKINQINNTPQTKSSFLFCFCSARNGSQQPWHARQVLYLCSTSTATTGCTGSLPITLAELSITRSSSSALPDPHDQVFN